MEVTARTVDVEEDLDLWEERAGDPLGAMVGAGIERQPVDAEQQRVARWRQVHQPPVVVRRATPDRDPLALMAHLEDNGDAAGGPTACHVENMGCNHLFMLAGPHVPKIPRSAAWTDEAE